MNKLLFAGPCSVESREQSFKIARFVKEHEATVFRAGCWKGQNRPIVNGKPAYWGLGHSAVWILSDIQKELDLPCVTEVQCEEQVLACLSKGIAYLQVGTRHMQNFPLLRFLRDNIHLRDTQLILKRGLGNTVDEWIGAAEHLGGPDKVIMCERGTSHFDRTPTSRWRLDFNGVAFLKRYTKYRVIIDPSHGSGDRNLVYLLSKAALQIADGLMIEVHYEPDKSPTDASQTIDFKEFRRIGELYASSTRPRCN